MFLINKNIEFHPERCLLANKDGSQKISLPLSASRCLLALLLNKRPVLHQELYEFAWGEQHKEVTPNNLYQNISILRKAIKSIDESSSSWIHTIPKKGFIFNLNVPVEKIIDEELQQDGNPGEAGKTENNVKKTASFLNDEKKKGKYILLLLITLSVVAFIFINTLPRTAKVSDSFVFYKKIGQCRVYINDDMQEKNVQEKVLSQSETHCYKFPYNYVTAYSIMHSATILACDKPINNPKPHCVSYLQRGIAD